MEVTKNICCGKGEGAADHITVTRWFKNHNNQAMSGRPKTVNSIAMLQAIEGNLVSNTQRVSGELSISLSSVMYHLHDLGISMWNCGIVPHVTKILQNVCLSLVFFSSMLNRNNDRF